MTRGHFGKLQVVRLSRGGRTCPVDTKSPVFAGQGVTARDEHQWGLGLKSRSYKAIKQIFVDSEVLLGEGRREH